MRADVFPVQVETTAPKNEMTASIKKLDGGNCEFEPGINNVLFLPTCAIPSCDSKKHVAPASPNYHD